MATYDEEGDALILSTGKIIPCNMGIFGLQLREGICEPTYGCDGAVEDSDFTDTERREFADFNISLWMKYKERT